MVQGDVNTSQHGSRRRDKVVITEMKDLLEDNLTNRAEIASSESRGDLRRILRRIADEVSFSVFPEGPLHSSKGDESSNDD